MTLNALKGIVQLIIIQIYFLILCTQPQAIQDKFVSSTEQIWRNSALNHQWILCSEWVPSE